MHGNWANETFSILLWRLNVSRVLCEVDDDRQHYACNKLAINIAPNGSECDGVGAELRWPRGNRGRRIVPARPGPVFHWCMFVGCRSQRYNPTSATNVQRSWILTRAAVLRFPPWLRGSETHYVRVIFGRHCRREVAATAVTHWPAKITQRVTVAFMSRRMADAAVQYEDKFEPRKWSVQCATWYS